MKLLDFGIARRVDGDSGGLTTAGAIFGTPSYMAPELVYGASVADGRADLWSVGAVLHEGLTGRPPFTGPNPLAVLVAASQNDVPPIRAREPVPQALLDVVARALARDPEARFPTAEAMAAALRAVEWREDAAPVVTRTIEPGSVPPAPPPVAAPRRWPWAALAGGVVAAVVGWAATRESPDRPQAPAEGASGRPGAPGSGVEGASGRHGAPGRGVDGASGRPGRAGPDVDLASAVAPPSGARDGAAVGGSQPVAGREGAARSGSQPASGRDGATVGGSQPAAGREGAARSGSQPASGREGAAATPPDVGGPSGEARVPAPASAPPPPSAAPPAEPEILPPPPR